MSAFTYTATRGVIAGHTIGANYNIDIPIKEYDETNLVKGKQLLTGSAIETIINDVILQHKFQTVPIEDIGKQLEIREFILSATDGQTITFDIHGTVALPINQLLGTLKLNKTIRPGRPGHKLVDYSFEIIEVS